MTTPYHPPVKRSLAIHGHKTSISLEPLFWTMLKEAAAREGAAMAQLVARIDGERIKADPAPGLAGAIRVWLVVNAHDSHEKGAARPATAPAEEPNSDQ
jgi:predicted DNA-binding ribbon-helix-helix protein